MPKRNDPCLKQEDLFPLKSNTNISFGTQGTEDIPIVITGHQGYFTVSSGIPYRVYPYDNDMLYDASYGEVEYESNNEDRVFEVVRFNGSTEASFSKYPDRIESYELMGRIISINGDEGAEDGSRESVGGTAGFTISRSSGGTSSITVTYDAQKRKLVASAPCFAIFKVFYYATYAIVRYRPELTSNVFSSFWGRGYGAYTYGTIVAQLDNSFGIYDVEPPINQDTNVAVLYQVYTETIANEAGQWEKPDVDWPDGATPSYSSGGGSNTPDPADGYQENQRLHQQATIDESGLIRIRDYPVSTSAGPVGGTWSPTYLTTNNINQLATDDIFQAGVQRITEQDKLIITSRLAQYGLEFDDL